MADPDHVAQLLAGARPEATALSAPGRDPLVHGALKSELAAVAGALNGFGIGRADRVAIVLPNGPEMAAAFLGVVAVAAAAPLNPAYREAEFDFYLADLNAKAVLVESGAESPVRGVAARRAIPVIELVPRREAPAGRFQLRFPAGGSASRRASPAADDVALVLHTSGTTSRPKIVPLTQRNLAASAAGIARTLRLTEADRCLNVMPLFHIHGLVGVLLASLAAGGSVFCTPGFNALKFHGWLEESGATWYSAVPTMHQAILARSRRNRDAIRRLRLIRSSSAALAPQVMAGLEAAFGCPVIESYGMTEAAHQMTSNPLPPMRRKPGTVGIAAGPEVAVLDPSGRPQPPGEPGEVAIRGAGVTSGYENDPAANRAAFVAGWLRTGDEGVFDAEGYLTITGRLKELINRGGEKVSPREVEEALLDHPAVGEAVAFALPHDKLGEEVAAAVVLGAGARAEEHELREFLRRRLADFKVPRKIVFLDEMPKGATGKPQRIGLAKRLGLAP